MHQVRMKDTTKCNQSTCLYLVNRWDPPPLDPTYDILNKREAPGKLLCFCQNDSIAKS